MWCVPPMCWPCSALNGIRRVRLRPDALRAEACEEVPLLDGATHCFVSATITRSQGHPVARIIGDWLVLQPSASGRSRTRRIPFKAEHGLHVGGVNHFALLNHPEIYAKLREWLRTPPAQLAAGEELSTESV